MKNLANCKPTEFMKQTNLIRRSVEKWLTATDIINLRNNMPTPKKVLDSMTDEEKSEVIAGNIEARNKQVRKNISQFMDAVFEKHPEETLEVLALICFEEPKNVDNHTMAEYLDALTELISNESVLGFFTSLTKLAS